MQFAAGVPVSVMETISGVDRAVTAFELSYLIGETEAFCDVIFNRWVQATFAVLVATYFAATRLNTLFLKLMGALYLAYSIAQASTLAFQTSKLVDYTGQLETIIGDYAGNIALSAPAGILTFMVYIIGTAATLYFVYHTQKSAEAGNE